MFVRVKSQRTVCADTACVSHAAVLRGCAAAFFQFSCMMMGQCPVQVVRTACPGTVPAISEPRCRVLPAKHGPSVKKVIGNAALCTYCFPESSASHFTNSRPCPSSGRIPRKDASRRRTFGASEVQPVSDAATPPGIPAR